MRPFSRFRASLAFAACATLAAACSGSHTSPMPSVAKTTSSAKTAKVTFKIKVPAKPASKTRKPNYVSEATESASITITPSGGSAETPIVFNCQVNACTTTFDAPIGTNTYAVSLYDNGNGQGNLLSSGTASSKVVLATANTVSLTFNPVLAGFYYYGGNQTFDANVAQTNTVQYTGTDADGYTIVGPGNYETSTGAASSIAFSSSNPLTHVSVPTAPATAPTNGAPNLAITYDGTPPRGNYYTNIVATIPSVTPSPGNNIITATVDASFANFTPLTDPNIDGTTTPVSGSDGNLWLGEDLQSNGVNTGELVKYTVAGATTAEFLTTSQNRVRDLVLGGDGNVWFDEINDSQSSTCNIGKITTSGTVTEYPLPGAAAANNSCGQYNDDNTYGNESALGSDGNVWFVAQNYTISTSGQEIPVIMKVTSSGAVTTYQVGNGGDVVYQLAPGPNSKLWYIKSSGSTYRLGSIDVNGNKSESILGSSFSYNYYAPLLYAPDGTFYLGTNHLSTTGQMLSNSFGGDTCAPLVVLPKGLALAELAGNDSGEGICNFSASTATYMPYSVDASGAAEGQALYGNGGVVLGSDGNVYYSNNQGGQGYGIAELIW